jgi:four helix bundle protein
MLAQKLQGPKFKEKNMKKFRTLDLAVEFYRKTETLKLAGNLKDQLLRAASSIALNLSEGNAKRTAKEKKHFFYTAYASCQECKTILKLTGFEKDFIADEADRLGAYLFKLLKSDIQSSKIT